MSSQLFIRVRHAGSAKELSQFLQALDDAYTGLYLLEKISEDIEPFLEYWSYYRYVHWFDVDRHDPSDFVLEKDMLHVAAVEIHSPGYWKLLGSKGPLEVIRKSLNDRHERKKDREYRNDQERRRLELENERRDLENEGLATSLLRERLQLLRDAGVPQAEIDRLLVVYAERPLNILGQHVDSGMIQESDVDQSDDTQE